MSPNENQSESTQSENVKAARADLNESGEPRKKPGRKPKAESAAPVKPRAEKKTAKRGPKPGAKKTGKKRGPKPGTKRGGKPKTATVVEPSAAVEQPWPGLVAFLLVSLYELVGKGVKAWSEWQGRRALKQSEKLVARARAMDALARAMVV